MTLRRTILFACLAVLSALQGMAQEPKVTTDPRFVRGSTMAFGRIKSASINGGTAITKRGFCYAEHPDPTINDMVTTATLNNNGTIYWLKDLKPATRYYMRAYAVNKDNLVGYGDVIRFFTVPFGNVSYNYNNGGDADANQRINDALTKACYYFNNMTSTTRHYNVGYGSGTPTADCNYQPEPWMNVGPNQSYQRCGTIMHEMQHGLGLQNYLTQWSKGNLRSGNGTGQWLGDRVTQALQFWDNNTTTVLNGDGIHMWPYGVNGAHEDNGSEELYLANAMICQALGEDGLEHNETRHADPYYSLEQEDTLKYYLKNESASRGRYTAYLIPLANGTLRWRDMTATDAAQNDSAAWYITFTPENQYYQLRNVATGQYLTYSSGIKTMNRASLTANEDWHLMPGRVDVDGMRGYWIIHPSTGWTPPCLQANLNGLTAAKNFNIANSAEDQRWLIMNQEEMLAAEMTAVANLRQEATDVLAQVKDYAQVPHQEDVAGADQQLAQAIVTLESRIQAATSTSELQAIISEAHELGMTFLQSVTATDLDHPFNLSSMLQNPTLDKTSDGWSQTATVNYGCAEYYEQTFDFNQTVKGLPAGTYQICVQGFQRPGPYASASTVDVNTFLYVGAKTQKLCHIKDYSQERKIGKGNEVAMSGRYVPNNMEASSAYFTKGLYENRINAKVSTSGSQFKFGLRCTSMGSGYWVIFDNFRLLYYGNLDSEALGIRTLSTAGESARQGTYTLDGRRLSGDAPLRPGLYIVDGRKVMVK